MASSQGEPVALPLPQEPMSPSALPPSLLPAPHLPQAGQQAELFTKLEARGRSCSVRDGLEILDLLQAMARADTQVGPARPSCYCCSKSC